MTLHLREGEDELLDGHRLRAIIRKYSDHITLPILMKKEEWDKDKGENQHHRRGRNRQPGERAVGAAQGRDHRGAVPRVLQACGARLRGAARLCRTTRVEGRKEYTQLLYIPARAPFDLWDREHRHGIKLYVRRVFIMDDAEQLMPHYLRFVRGVIDSSDLPLNVSREILQQSKDIEAIRAGSVKRVLSMLEDLAENHKDKFATFWKEFGRVLKEGVGEDHANRERIAKLLRFASTHKDTEDAGRVARRLRRAHEAGAGEDLLRHRRDLRRGEEQPAPRSLPQEGRRSAAAVRPRRRVGGVASAPSSRASRCSRWRKGELDLGKLEDEAEKKEQEKEAGEYKDLVEKIKKALGERVKDVRVTLRLTESPACLVADEHDMGANLQRHAEGGGPESAGVEADPRNQPAPSAGAAAQGRSRRGALRRLAAVLFDQALLAEGGQLEDPAGFVKRLNQLMLAMGGE